MPHDVSFSEGMLIPSSPNQSAEARKQKKWQTLATMLGEQPLAATAPTSTPPRRPGGCQQGPDLAGWGLPAGHALLSLSPIALFTSHHL